MYKSKSLLNNVNDGESISKYDILNLFYYKKNILIQNIKNNYNDIFDEDVSNLVSEKKEEELTEILNCNENCNYKNNNIIYINKQNTAIKNYFKKNIIKHYFFKLEQYERIEHFYNIIILDKILSRKRKYLNKVKMQYKKQSINCIKSLKSGLLIPFFSFKYSHSYKKLFLFLLLSIPPIIGSILLFFTSIIALFLHTCNNIVNKFKKFIRIKKIINKNKILHIFLSFLFYLNLFSSKLILIISKLIYSVSNLIYKILSSFQFSLLKNKKYNDKIINNIDNYIANDNKIKQIRKNKIQNNFIKNTEKNKSKFQKLIEIEFDKLIYNLIS